MNSPVLQGGDLKDLKAGAQGLKSAETGAFAKSGTTDNNGHIELTDLPIGLYLVHEDISAATKANPGLTAGADFLVFVPTTTPDGKAWDYKVTVYPKNAAGGITKAVVDKDKNVGDVITYTIDADIPIALDGKSLTKFEIWDHLDVTKLAPSTKDWPTSSAVAFVNGGEISSSLYNITFDNGTSTVKVEFNPQGRSFLQQNLGKQVRLTIQAKMKAVGNGNGVIVNKSELVTNQPGSDSDNKTPSNEVVTYLGKVKIVKQADGREGKHTLSGAQFELYRCSASTVKGLIGGPLTVNGTKTWTTGADGTITIDGLHVTDIQNATETINNQYCLKEIAAPSGYVLPQGDAAVTAFKLDRGDVAGQAPTAIAQLSKDVTILNKKSDTPDLPLTGGQGIALLVILGAGVAGAAVYSARRNSTKA
ncbi:SpaH/EbpB family LPXTG-anchored major pilin [Arcanobacterium canis]